MDWAIFVSVVLGLYGTGVAIVGISHNPHFGLTRLCFGGATVAALGQLVWWGSRTHMEFSARAAVVGIVGAAIAIVGVEALRWVSEGEKAHTKKTSEVAVAAAPRGTPEATKQKLGLPKLAGPASGPDVKGRGGEAIARPQGEIDGKSIERGPPARVEVGPAPQSSSAPQPFWPIVGCAMSPGVPTDATPFAGLSHKALRNKVVQQTKALKVFERAHNERIDRASQFPGDFKAVQAELKKVTDEDHERYATQFLQENISLVDELLMRLNLPHPQSTADGVTVDGFAAVCGAQLRGKRPLSDLSAYLETLAARLPK